MSTKQSDAHQKLRGGTRRVAARSERWRMERIGGSGKKEGATNLKEMVAPSTFSLANDVRLPNARYDHYREREPSYPGGSDCLAPWVEPQRSSYRYPDERSPEHRATNFQDC